MHIVTCMAYGKNNFFNFGTDLLKFGDSPVLKTGLSPNQNSLNYFMSNIAFTIPLSINFENIFFIIINTIGPTNIPIIPINLKPVYIDIIVNIGCIPILPLTILGSINCLTSDIIIHNAIIDNPNVSSPFSPEIIPHGIITVPEPNIGKASTKAIRIAAISGKPTLNFKKCKMYRPIKLIKKDIIIKNTCAFKYPPNDFTNSLMCFDNFLIHFSGKWCSSSSIIYILSVQIKYNDKKVTQIFIEIT